MATIRTEQPTFSAGEVSPEIAARTDVAKYQSALRLARNVIGLPQGGLLITAKSPAFSLCIDDPEGHCSYI